MHTFAYGVCVCVCVCVSTVKFWILADTRQTFYRYVVYFYDSFIFDVGGLSVLLNMFIWLNWLFLYKSNIGEFGGEGAIRRGTWRGGGQAFPDFCVRTKWMVPCAISVFDFCVLMESAVWQFIVMSSTGHHVAIYIVKSHPGILSWHQGDQS